MIECDSCGFDVDEEEGSAKKSGAIAGLRS